MKKQLRGIVTLPGSKSESNRALMIAAYGGFSLEADNLSNAHDTALLEALLDKVNGMASDEPVRVAFDGNGKTETTSDGSVNPCVAAAGRGYCMS